MKHLKYFGVALLVIAIDQVVKMLVHYNMEMGTIGQIKIFGDWFKLHYTTNPGMAFGLQLGTEYGKLALTSFRLVAMFGIGYYLYYLSKNGAKAGLLICVGMILGGAIGNLIDSMFYGVWLGNAPYDASTPWFHGQVVDMFYLDIWEGIVPEWIPFWGGSYTALWPIFNIADAAIFTGVAFIILYQKRFFDPPKIETVQAAVAEPTIHEEESAEEQEEKDADKSVD